MTQFGLPRKGEIGFLSQIFVLRKNGFINSLKLIYHAELNDNFDSKFKEEKFYIFYIIYMKFLGNISSDMYLKSYDFKLFICFIGEIHLVVSFFIG